MHNIQERATNALSEQSETVRWFWNKTADSCGEQCSYSTLEEPVVRRSDLCVMKTEQLNTVKINYYKDWKLTNVPQTININTTMSKLIACTCMIRHKNRNSPLESLGLRPLSSGVGPTRLNVPVSLWLQGFTCAAVISGNVGLSPAATWNGSYSSKQTCLQTVK